MQQTTPPWAMIFQAPIEADTFALIRDLLGEPIGHDRQTFLFESLPRLTQIGLSAITARAGHRPALALFHVADVVALGDGQLFRATLLGWQPVVTGSKAPGRRPSMTEREMITGARSCVGAELRRLELMAMREQSAERRRLYEIELERLYATLDSIDAYLGLPPKSFP